MKQIKIKAWYETEKLNALLNLKKKQTNKSKTKNKMANVEIQNSLSQKKKYNIGNEILTNEFSLTHTSCTMYLQWTRCEAKQYIPLCVKVSSKSSDPSLTDDGINLTKL